LILKEKRDEFIDSTKQQLIGTKLKDNILVGEKPLDRFFTGFLFPILTGENGFDLESELKDEDSVNPDLEKEEVKSVKKEKRYIPPSSAGFSFFITGTDIKLRVFYNAVSYKDKDKRDEYNQKFVVQQWEKTYLADDGKEIEFSLNGAKQYKIFNGKAKIDALWRPYNDGYIVTITISNNTKIDSTISSKEFNLEQNRHTLFEVELKCIVEEGNLDIYPSKDKALLSEEEKEIELRYKDLYIYAVGHGSAVNWAKNSKQKMEIWIDFLPTVEVPQVTADTGGKSDKVLEFSFLKDCVDNNRIIEELDNFVNSYKNWIDSQNNFIEKEDEEDKVTARSIVKKLSIARKRMQEGVALLRNDRYALVAFATANEAMLKQWVSGDTNRGIQKDDSEYKWRPFQLAFILMTLESATNENSVSPKITTLKK
jgi:hypothetical protein